MKNIDWDSLFLVLKNYAKRDEKFKNVHLWNSLSFLHEALGRDSWVGLYLDKDGELLLGPFQGTPACEHIAYGRGVVGSCYEQNKTLAVSDVTKFPGYICCDASAKSEICVACPNKGVLDIDFAKNENFSEEDIRHFEEVSELLFSFIS